AAAQDVEACGGAGDDRRRPQRQIENVWRQLYRAGAGGEEGKQGPGVEEAGLIGMVLEADHLHPGPLAALDQGHQLLRALCGWGQKGAELDRVPVVAHATLIRRSSPYRPVWTWGHYRASTGRSFADA